MCTVFVDDLLANDNNSRDIIVNEFVKSFTGTTTNDPVVSWN